MFPYTTKPLHDRIIDFVDRVVKAPWQPIAALGLFALLLIVIGILRGRS